MNLPAAVRRWRNVKPCDAMTFFTGRLREGSVDFGYRVNPRWIIAGALCVGFGLGNWGVIVYRLVRWTFRV